MGGTYIEGESAEIMVTKERGVNLGQNKYNTLTLFFFSRKVILIFRFQEY